MLQITSIYNNAFYDNEFKIGSSGTSYFIPFINCIDNNFNKTDDGELIIYHKPLIKGNQRRFLLAQFLGALNQSLSLQCYNIGTNESNVLIHVGNGYIVNEKDEILMILAIKPFTDIRNKGITYQSRYSTEPIKEVNAINFTLFVSTELITNPLYANFYKKLDKEYISDAYKAKLPVVFTTSAKIEKLIYSNEFDMTFNTIDEFNIHLKESVGQIMFKMDDDFKLFNPGISNNPEDKQLKYVAQEVVLFEETTDMIPNQGIYQQVTNLGITTDFNNISYQNLEDAIHDLTTIPDSYFDRPITPVVTTGINLIADFDDITF